MTSNTDFPLDSGAVVPAATTEPRPFYWSVRRELMENRFVYIAPLVVTAFVLFGSLASLLGRIHRIESVGPARQDAWLMHPFSMAPAPIMLATFLIGFFYSIDALYGERRDRSILFWKSLPVSDTTTVLSKAAIPTVVLPAIAFLLSVATQILMLIVAAPFLIANGRNPVALYADFGFIGGFVIMIYGLTVHALWFAPIYAWLILISAWVRRAPLLWAVLPPLVLVALERMVLSTYGFGHLLRYRFIGAMSEAFVNGARGDIKGFSQLSPLKFLGAPGLWVGLIAAAIFLAAAVRLRRNREPI